MTIDTTVDLGTLVQIAVIIFGGIWFASAMNAQLEAFGKRLDRLENDLRSLVNNFLTRRE